MQTLNDYIDSINNSIETIQRNKITIDDVKPEDLPSDFKLMMGNTMNNSRLMQFVFDTKLDRIIDNLLNRILNGDFSEIDQYSSMIKKIFEKLGVGEDAFSGPVSQALLNNITNSLNSLNFNLTKSKIKRCMILIKSLKTRASDFKDKDAKKKYLEAVYALKETLRFIAKVYKNRRILTNRVMKGLNNAIHESIDDNEELDFDF